MEYKGVIDNKSFIKVTHYHFKDQGFPNFPNLKSKEPKLEEKNSFALN